MASAFVCAIKGSSLLCLQTLIAAGVDIHASFDGKTALDMCVKYYHIKELGGLRHAKKDSINTAWRNASFRGFADYMQTEEYKKGLLTLLNLAETHKVVLMCSEALPWRCHRSLIADSLTVRGIEVIDIFTKHSAKIHTLTPWAQVEGNTITYPLRSSHFE